MTGERSEGVIIIGGGVGPMAGVALHGKIIESTAAAGDASHLTVVHLSRSAAIGDRTGFLLGDGERGENPGHSMARVVARAARALEEGEWAVGGIPCNSFHAPAIYEPFLERLAAARLPVRMLHIAEETMRLLDERLGGRADRDIGVLCTTGTRATGLYDRMLERAGHRAVYVDRENQDRLHEAIYHPEWGIKAVSPVSRRAVATVEAMAEELAGRGVAAILPACTELPLALPGTVFRGLPLVDPVVALARGLVRAAAPHKLLPL